MKRKKEQVVQKDLLLRPGQVVKVYQKIQEGNKERIQIYEGLVIDVKGKSGINHTMTVRKVVGGIGVEKIFTLESPKIEKVEIVRESKVRRANIGYVRKLTGKSARMKEEMVFGILGGQKAEPEQVEVPAEEVPVVEEAVAEAKQAE